MTKKIRQFIGRMFLDENFYLECPHCKKDFQFDITKPIKKECISCKRIMLLINFKYPSETSYRNLCNLCKEGSRKRNYLSPIDLYTILSCGTCLQEGKSIAEATVRVNSKGVWDINGLHQHQKGIYQKEKVTGDPFEIN